MKTPFFKYAYAKYAFAALFLSTAYALNAWDIITVKNQTNKPVAAALVRTKISGSSRFIIQNSDDKKIVKELTATPPKNKETIPYTETIISPKSSAKFINLDWVYDTDRDIIFSQALSNKKSDTAADLEYFKTTMRPLISQRFMVGTKIKNVTITEVNGKLIAE